jgi:hypothetical protein
LACRGRARCLGREPEKPYTEKIHINTHELAKLVKAKVKKAQRNYSTFPQED